MQFWIKGFPFEQQGREHAAHGAESRSKNKGEKHLFSNSSGSSILIFSMVSAIRRKLLVLLLLFQ